MKAACCGRFHPRQRPGMPPRGRWRKTVSTLSAVLSSTALILMPKCPLCLAGYVTLVTGVSLSAVAARHLYVGLIVACGGLMVFALIRLMHGWWREKNKPVSR